MCNSLQIIQDHYDDPYHRGECENATHEAEQQCPETGCQLRFELRIDAGRVDAAWFDGCGCQLCEGLASILADAVEGASIEKWHSLSLQDCLQENGLEVDSPAACITLPLETLQSAMKSPIEALDGDLADGTGFGGPSLREEC